MIPTTIVKELRHKVATLAGNIGTKIHTVPRCGLVTLQIAKHILCSTSFGVVLFAKVCFSYWCNLKCAKLHNLQWLYCTQTLTYNISQTITLILIILQFLIASSLLYKLL